MRWTSLEEFLLYTKKEREQIEGQQFHSYKSERRRRGISPCNFCVGVVMSIAGIQEILPPSGPDRQRALEFALRKCEKEPGRSVRTMVGLVCVMLFVVVIAVLLTMGSGFR